MDGKQTVISKESGIHLTRTVIGTLRRSLYTDDAVRGRLMVYCTSEEAASAQRVHEHGGDVVQGTGEVIMRDTHAEAVEATTEFVKCPTRPHMKAGSPYFTAAFEDYLESQGRELYIESEADLEVYLDE